MKVLSLLLMKQFQKEIDCCMETLGLMTTKRLVFYSRKATHQLSVLTRTDGVVITERKQENFTECLSIDLATGREAWLKVRLEA